MDTDTDELLWVASLHGDGDAFGVLFDRHHARVHRHASRLLGPADAQDATAAAFLELWRRREAVHLTAGSVLPWLLVTTTNVARNTHRSTRRYRDLLHRLHHQPDLHEVPDIAEVLAAQSVGDQSLTAALRSLKVTDLHLITLVVLEGLSLTEAADTLGLSPGAVKTRLHRARARLRAALVDHPAATHLRTAEGQHS